MTLSDYIEQNLDRLLEEWVEFAATRLPASEFMSIEALTNGSKELMHAIVADMKMAQNEDERAAKGRGERDEWKSAISKTAREHAEHRLQDGFTLDQVVAEYRALRASVIRCWTADLSPGDQQMRDELVRFNEAMDQSLAEAVRWFSKELGRMRDTFVGVLGHDLRDPLNAALTANELQGFADSDPGVRRRANETTNRNLRRMVSMVHDLLDFARTRLDGTLPVSLEDADMKTICVEIAEAAQLSSKGREIRLKFSGDLSGRWDTDRIKQVLSNLIQNALDHGDARSPIKVIAQGEADEVALAVHNQGNPIPLEVQHVIFDPFMHRPPGRQRPDSLGLGLYIVKQIVDAHRGSLELESTAESGTTFTIRLPRQPT